LFLGPEASLEATTADGAKQIRGDAVAAIVDVVVVAGVAVVVHVPRVVRIGLVRGAEPPVPAASAKETPLGQPSLC